jgi:hypothetical protein
MRNMERQNFEDAWKKAFDQAEVPPSSSVWTNIELDLERANGNRLKKRLAFFQLLAAASVIFSLGVGTGIFLIKSSSETTSTAQSVGASPKFESENAVAEPPASSPIASSEVQSGNNTQPLTLNKSNDYTSTINSTTSSNVKPQKNFSANDNVTAQSRRIAIIEEEKRDQTGIFGAQRERSLALAERKFLPEIVKSESIQLHVDLKPEQPIIDPVQLMLAKLEQREREVGNVSKSKDKRSATNEKLWTSVGFAAGSYNKANGGFQQKEASSPMSLSAARQTSTMVEKEAKASGVAYSVGANIGTKLSDRWVFQGGVNYLTQSSDYTAQGAIAPLADHTSFRPPSINELKKISAADATEQALVNTPPYNVNNSLRYLSVPLQAGFLLVNKNIGVQLNAGVSTDVFLQNTVSAEGGNLAKTNDALGDKSSYRSVNLSGLAGTELSYRFSKNYRVALNPGIRYPFNSIYRSDAQISSTPITFDIGLRFRYIFH